MIEIVKINAKLMLNRRGYDKVVTIDDTIVGSKGCNACAAEITCYFVEGKKVTIDVIKMILSRSTTMRIIIVYRETLTSDAKQAIAINKIFHFEIFSYDEMSYDPVDITYPHSLLPEERRPKEWYKLPIISQSDMISRYYGYKSGDIIRIDEDYVSLRRCA